MMCPCHSNKKYEECCLPFHEGGNAPDALALMRSRYSAYALKKVDYIIKTTHHENPDCNVPLAQRRDKIKKFCESVQFNNLIILDFNEKGHVAFVTFRAFLTQNGQDISFTEKSQFFKVGKKWLYHSGKIDN